MFIREIAQTNSGMRASILQRLLDSFYSIRSSRVCATALWIIGEYSETREQVEEALATLKSSLGETPFFEPPSDERFVDDTEEEKEVYESGSKRPIVLADGTYATQTAVQTSGGGPSTPNLRALLLSGDFFLAAICGGTLTKLGLRYMKSNTFSEDERNRTQAEVMLYIVAILRLGKSHVVAHEMDYDSTERLTQCFAAIESPESETTRVWLENCRESFSLMISEKLENDAKEREKKEEKPKSQADDLIDFYHLKSRKGLSQVELEDAVATDLRRATGFNDPDAASNARDSKLNRVLQLTGFSDPVYAESYVTVHQYDIVMDVTATNRTNEVLQNVCLELATMGDLKLVERPQNYTLAPGESKHIRANIKVSSTETGVIFGNIVYESRNEDRNVVVLNDIHIDIMDYISPASCADIAFRNMWAEFEWENKVAVNTKFTDVKEYLDHVVKSTNMRCLTPESALDGECGFLAANLYAKSVFGEDALVNVSVEKDKDGKLGGYIRIRSKTQGIALSLGDKITLKQRGPEK
jgi:coatomer subunit beta